MRGMSTVSSDSRLVLACLGLAWAAGTACFTTTQTARIVEPPPVMYVYNGGRVTVEAVLARPCGTGDNAFYRLGGTTAPPGSGFEIPMLEGCVDLEAVDLDGNVLGRQFGLQMMPGATWEIR
jgi:hypothetical protein